MYVVASAEDPDGDDDEEDGAERHGQSASSVPKLGEPALARAVDTRHSLQSLGDDRIDAP